MTKVNLRVAIRSFGVVGCSLASLLLCAPASAGLVWQSLAPFARPIPGTASSHGIEGASASLIGGKIYVSHGLSGATGDNAETNIYDIATDSWTYGGPLAPNAAFNRSELGSGTVGGKHYAIGGRTVPNTAVVEEFDPGTATWTTKSSMLTGRGGFGAATSGGKIYAIGGRAGGAPGSGPPLGVNEVYDPSTDMWSTLAPLSVPVLDNYATIASGGKVYVFGGQAAGGFVGTTQIYDIATNTWGTGTAMPTARTNAMAGIIDIGGIDWIAVFGGVSAAFVNLATTELYNPLTDTWMAGPNMITPTSEMAVGITYDNSGIYAIGEGIFGRSGPTVQRLAFVPEPTTLLLLGLGLAGLGFARKRLH